MKNLITDVTIAFDYWKTDKISKFASEGYEERISGLMKKYRLQINSFIVPNSNSKDLVYEDIYKERDKINNLREINMELAHVVSERKSKLREMKG